MDLRELLERVRGSAPFAPGEAEHATEVALYGFASYLPPKTGRALLRQLGLHEGAGAESGAFAAGAGRSEAAGSPLSALAAQIASAEGLEAPRALEHLQIVGRALAEQLDPALLAQLRGELPDELGELLDETRGRSAETPSVHHARTLAEGRPGSRRSLSASAPGSERPISGARPDSPHRHSVAEQNPHGDTKLSSAAGSTQEREQESLATGRAKTP